MKADLMKFETRWKEKCPPNCH